jgi:hypothetical protein
MVFCSGALLMGIRQIVVAVLLLLSCPSLMSREIVEGMELVADKKMAFLFTPIVLPDLLSVKLAFERSFHPKFNWILPVEAKWMDYRRVIKFGAQLFNAPDKNIPESWYGEKSQMKSGWNIDIYHFKISSGLGLKWFPFSQAMTNAFFVKAMMMAGYERLVAYGADGLKEGAIFTQVGSVGYTWVKRRWFTFGVEVGEEYSFHTNPIEHMPILLDGLLPFLQFSLGFTI